MNKRHGLKKFRILLAVTFPNNFLYFDKVPNSKEEALVIFFKIVHVHAMISEHLFLKPFLGSASAIILPSLFIYCDNF